MIFYGKKSIDLAKKYSLLTAEKLKNHPESPYNTLHEMVEFQFTKRTDNKEILERYQHALKLLEENGFVNNYLSVGLTVPWSLINDISARPKIDAQIQKCYELAKKIDNQHLVSKACHWKGIIYSHYGEDDASMMWCDECNRIRTEIGEIGPILNIRNGLSYESLRRTEYENAYNLVNDVIKNIYNVSDYSSVIDILKNTGYALFYSRHFDQAAAVFNRILHYLSIFGMEDQTNNSFLPSTGDMLVFKTIIDLDNGDYIHGKINYNAIFQNSDSITMEDKPMIKFLEAELCASEGNIEAACSSMDSCIEEFKTIKSNQKHKICFCCYEFARLLSKLEKSVPSEKYLAYGHNVAVENKFLWYSLGKEKITLNDYFSGIKPFAPLNIDLAFLDEKAEKEVLVSEMHRRIHDYQFLNKLKSSNGDYTSFENYINNSLLSIYDYAVADMVALCEFKNGKYETIGSIFRNERTEISPAKWNSMFEKTKNVPNCEFSFISDDYSFGDLSQFDYRFGILIQQGKKSPMTADVISTLNIALATIQAQITIFKQNENLMFLSTTDQLSLLNNRHALTTQLSVESEKISRTIQKNRTPPETTIAFIDLDHFKYYNDTFGHGAGDMLINRFANLLKKTCRQTDFVSRFGGDEFVIIMDDTDEKEAAEIFAGLQKNIRKAKHFIPDLQKHLAASELNIPDSKVLGFSMGIASNYDLENTADLNTVLGNADKALYYTKEHCKGNYSVWKEVKNKI